MAKAKDAAGLNSVLSDCSNPPALLYMIYKYKMNKNEYRKFSTAVSFVLNIPKGATINKAVFTCTTTGHINVIPLYDVYLRILKPDNDKNFLETCLFNDNLLTGYRKWIFVNSGTTIGDNVPISTNNVKDLVNYFVNHASYTPGSRFHLVMKNSLLANKEPIKKTIYFHLFHDDEAKRPRLYVEWSEP